MTTPNKHIEDFLEYYYQFPNPPEYAVLLKGAWGSGKTWFIKKSLKESKEIGEFIYISLYGVKSTKKIEQEIMTQLFIEKSGLVKNEMVKKGLSALKKAFGEKVPDFNILSFIPKNKNYIFIFDDLERCSMHINDVLGYINHFVEHQGFKAIIIANEKVIQEKQSSGANSEQTELIYKDIKEKLIGEIFEVKADLEGALDDFISNFDSKEIMKFYEEQKQLISNLYIQSTYDNLRHLKRALWGFERFYQILSEKVKSSNELQVDLLKLYLVYLFEIKSGKLLAENLKPKRSSNKKGSPFDLIEKKYTDLLIPSLYFPILEIETWEEIFGKGLLDSEVINSYLLDSKYFQENTPDWLKLWGYWEITDDDFNKSFATVKKSFKDRKYEEIGEVKHVVAEFLQFSKMGLYNKSKEEILDKAREYVKWLRGNNKLPDIHVDRYRWNNSYGGYGFLGEDSEGFQEFCQFIDSQIDEAGIEKLPETGKDLLKLMANDVNAFAGKLILLGYECTYCDVPILSSINPEQFVDTFISLSPFGQNLVSRVFEKRYSFKNNCEDEKEWLIKINELMGEKQELLEGQLSGFRLGRYRVTLKKAIKEIEK